MSLIILGIIALIIVTVFIVWNNKINHTIRVIKDMNFAFNAHSDREIRIYVEHRGQDDDHVTVNGSWYRIVYYPNAVEDAEFFIFPHDDSLNDIHQKITEAGRLKIMTDLHEYYTANKGKADDYPLRERYKRN